MKINFWFFTNFSSTDRCHRFKRWHRCTDLDHNPSTIIMPGDSVISLLFKPFIYNEILNDSICILTLPCKFLHRTNRKKLHDNITSQIFGIWKKILLTQRRQETTKNTNESASL
jgi:hypothetical protein